MLPCHLPSRLFHHRQLHLPTIPTSAAGYLPCDPGYPDDRLGIYLEDAGANVLLTEPAHRQRAEGLVGADCPVLDVAEAQQRGTGGVALGRRCCPEDPAYIIFTSGSTGRPKGCALPHRGLQDLLPWLVELHGLGPEDVVLFTNTISFDAHVLQVRWERVVACVTLPFFSLFGISA